MCGRGAVWPAAGVAPPNAKWNAASAETMTDCDFTRHPPVVKAVTRMRQSGRLVRRNNIGLPELYNRRHEAPPLPPAGPSRESGRNADVTGGGRRSSSETLDGQS